MISNSYHCFGLTYLVIGPLRWEREHSTDFWFRCYEVLDAEEAARALREIARDDVRSVRRLASEVLGCAGDVHAGGHGWSSADERLLERLTRTLGITSARGQPPDFASIYVCRRKNIAATPEHVPDAKPRTSETIDAARRAPRGFVVVEAVTDAGLPVPHVRFEVLLADGEVIAGAADAAGRLHLAPIPQGHCHIRVVGVDGRAWWPEAGEASACIERTSKRSHTVKDGQNSTRIARLHGISSWTTLWNAAENEELRNKRKSPNLLYPGDQVVVPGIEIHAIRRPTDTTHRIVIGKARAVVALLNAHLLEAATDVGVRWDDGICTLAAGSALFRDETSLSLRLNDASEHAGLALIAPAPGVSGQPTTAKNLSTSPSA